MTTDALIERAERAEAEMFHQLISMAPADVKTRFGIATTRFSGGVVTSVRDDVTGYWSDAMGFGIDEPVTTALVDQVVDFFTAEANPDALIHIAPALLPEDWPAICARHGLRPSGARYQHICPVEDLRTVASTDLRVGPATDGLDWTRFTMREFGMPEDDFASLLAPGYSSGNVKLFAAWDGDLMVAGASVFIWQDVAVLNSSSTSAGHRNRGAQSALIAIRAAAAADAGCRWLVTQTGRPEPGTVNPSLNNMIRAGLAPLYARPVWAWRAP
jgi:hypothetical protein